MEDVKYFIGLDIGTASVGWSVIDESGKLLKYKGQNMWGSRLFDEGNTAEKRRNFRSQRRRIKRKKDRIILLQKLFENEINKVDPNFFMRLEESFLDEDDKHVSNHYNLFCDKEYNDKNYFKKYRTIYHLRYALMTEDKKFDIRLIYLACHNIIKNRGNFIKEGQEFNINNLDIKEILTELLYEMSDIGININPLKIKDIDFKKLDKEISNNLNKTQFSKEIANILENAFDDKKELTEFANLLAGRTTNVSNLLRLSNKETVGFTSIDFDEKLSKISDLDDEYYNLVFSIKELYDMIELKRIFKNSKEPSISNLMIQNYDNNGEDLKILKELFKKNLTKKEYDEYFRNDDNILNKYMKNTSSLSYEEFKKKILKTLEKIDSSDKEYIIDRLEKDEFLRKLKSNYNGIFPYQLHLYELNKIITNQSKYYPFLLDSNEDNENKIELLLKFRIPYYVGPLNLNSLGDGKSRSFAWLSKTSNEKITPYNFNKVVDTVKSAENFIERMTNFCTYLHNEKVLPKNSLIYTKYMVISELKQIRNNGQPLDIDINKIIKDLFIDNNKTKITKKDLAKYLEKEKIEVGVLTGFQKENEFATNMKVYKDFIKIFGYIDNSNFEMIENIIKWITIFTDKKILKIKIKNSYPELDDETISKVAEKSYSGWGRFSREFLLGEKGCCYQDEFDNYSIMDLLETTPYNLIQILNHQKYGFEEIIDKYNDENQEKEYSVDDLSCSPAVKKGIRQAIKIVEEIIELKGYEPEHIFIEMTRSENAKKRTNSRQKQLQTLYRNIKDQVEEHNKYSIEYDKLTTEVNNTKIDIDATRLYLYFLQQGKCLYTGKRLEIENLSNDKLYEVDHILPRSLIKDDSLDNLALVFRDANQRKADGLSLTSDIITKQKDFWKYLCDHKFISSKKYYNLSRNDYSAKDIEGFINRQLVETSQIIKNAIAIFNKKYKDDMVVSVRANISHNYREKHKLYKFRELNDLHHAKDAYLAASLGSYLLIKYPNSKNHFIYNKYQNTDYFKNRNEKYNKLNNYGYILDNMNKPILNKDDEVILDTDLYIKTINKTMLQNDVLVTRKIETLTGEFYNQTIQKSLRNSNKKNIKLVPLKKGLDPYKYGGFNNVNKAYSILIRYEQNNKSKIKLVGIPIYIVSLNNKKSIDEYIKKELNIDNFEILKDKICKNTLIIYNNQPCYLCSDQEVCNAVQLKLSIEDINKYNDLLNYICNNKKIDDYDYEINMNKFIDTLREKIERHYPLYKNIYDKLTSSEVNDNINSLSLEEKKELILQILRILHANSENANLSNIGLTNREGRTGGKNINSGIIINQSITGLRSNKYEF